MGNQICQDVHQNLGMMMIACSSKKRKTNNPSIRGKNLFRPLGGIINDVKLFNGRLKEYLPNTIQSSNDQKLLLDRDYFIGWLQKHFSEQREGHFLFYTGHGYENGDWRFQTKQCPNGDKFSLQQLVQIWINHRTSPDARLFIFIDCCYAGVWCQRLTELDQKNISIFASSSRKQESKNTTEGGFFFKCLLESNNFQNNYQILMNFQNPQFIHNSKSVQPIKKQHLQMLQKNILNVFKINQDKNNNQESKSLKKVDAQEWINKKCYFYKDLILTDNQIKNSNQMFSVYIFGSHKIQSSYSFLVRFNKILKFACLGIIDRSYIKQKCLGYTCINNIIDFNNHGECWAMGDKICQGKGFRAKQVIEVKINFQDKTVEWLIGDQILQTLCIIKVNALSDKKITWVPYICLHDANDSVQILQRAN